MIPHGPFTLEFILPGEGGTVPVQVSGISDNKREVVDLLRQMATRIEESALSVSSSL